MMKIIYLIWRIDLSRLANTAVEDLNGDPGTEPMMLVLSMSPGWSVASLCLWRRGEPLSRGTLLRLTWGEWKPRLVFDTVTIFSPLHLWLELTLRGRWRLLVAKVTGTWGTETSRLFLCCPGLLYPGCLLCNRGELILERLSGLGEWLAGCWRLSLSSSTLLSE